MASRVRGAMLPGSACTIATRRRLEKRVREQCCGRKARHDPACRGGLRAPLRAHRRAPDRTAASRTGRWWSRGGRVLSHPVVHGERGARGRNLTAGRCREPPPRSSPAAPRGRADRRVPGTVASPSRSQRCEHPHGQFSVRCSLVCARREYLPRALSLLCGGNLVIGTLQAQMPVAEGGVHERAVMGL